MPVKDRTSERLVVVEILRSRTASDIEHLQAVQADVHVDPEEYRLHD